jgi:cell division septum initiation protein DivIVA
MKKKNILLIFFFVLLSILLIRFLVIIQIENLQAENLMLQQQIQDLQQQMNYLTKQETDIIDSLQKWLDEWDVMMGEVTGYAPLDPEAIEGWDYAGNPEVTASGGKVLIGKTAAGPPDVEFGKVFYLPQRKECRAINDRGSLINYNKAGEPQFDLAVKTKEEARAIGRSRELVVLQK